MTRRSQEFLLAAIVVGLLAPPALAAVIKGTVADDERARLPGVDVEARCGDSSVRTTTDVRGFYHLDVPEGEWTLTARLFVFAPEAKVVVVSQVGADADFVLRVRHLPPAIKPAPGLELRARLDGPSRVVKNEPFRVTIAITNADTTAWVFKHDWKWAVNTMYFKWTRPDGSAGMSGAFIACGDVATRCFQFKPLDAGDTFSFEVDVNGPVPDLTFPEAGTYDLEWRYFRPPSEGEDACGYPFARVWSGSLTSTPITIQVSP